MLKEVHNSQLQNGLQSDKVLGQMVLSNNAKTLSAQLRIANSKQQESESVISS